MTYAHVYPDMRIADYEFREFIDDRSDLCKTAKKCGTILSVTLYNGDEHHFMSRHVFDRWKMGRDYKFYYDEEKVYHSGFAKRSRQMTIIERIEAVKKAWAEFLDTLYRECHIDKLIDLLNRVCGRRHSNEH